jgi:hypothetical protein
LVPSPRRNLVADGHSQDRQLALGSARETSAKADHHIRVPSQHQQAETQPKPSTKSFVMLIPHHSWGVVGLDVLLLGICLALCLRLGSTRR